MSGCAHMNRDERCAACAPVPYRPSNGTEGMGFFERWCDRCRKEPDCPIIADTMIYDVDDSEYPKEWVADDASGNGARCTVFEEGEA